MNNRDRIITGRCRAIGGGLFACMLLAMASRAAAADAPATEPAAANAASSTSPAAPVISEEDIRLLVTQLGANKYTVRENAQARLVEVGPPAWGQLDKASKSPDPEVQRRAGEILVAIRASMATRGDSVVRRNLLWQYQLDRPVGSVTYCQGKIIFGAANEGVYALSADTGKKAWMFEGASFMSSFPLVAGKNVLFTAVGHGLFSCDLETGQTRWLFESQVPLRRTCTDGNLIYVASGFSTKGTSAGSLVAVDVASGKIAWQSELKDWIVGQPVFAEGKVFVNVDDHAVAAIDARTGKTAWTTGGNYKIVIGSPLAAAGRVFFLTADFIESENGVLRAVDAATGNLEWSRGHPVVRRVVLGGTCRSLAVYPSPVDFIDFACVDGKLYLPACGELTVFDAKTGRVEWSFDTLAAQCAERAVLPDWSEEVCGSIVAKPPLLIRDGVAYLGSGDGVYAIDLKTHKQLWKFHTRFPVAYRMSQADGVLYFSSPIPPGEARMHSYNNKPYEVSVSFRQTDFDLVGTPLVRPNEVTSTIYALRLPGATSQPVGAIPPSQPAVRPAK